LGGYDAIIDNQEGGAGREGKRGMKKKKMRVERERE
jgi:hypothetical protein